MTRDYDGDATDCGNPANHLPFGTARPNAVVNECRRSGVDDAFSLREACSNRRHVVVFTASKPANSEIVGSVTEREKLHPAEAIYAWLLVLNGVGGFVFSCIIAIKVGFSGPPFLFALPLLGVAAGAGSLKGWSAGFYAGTIFYLIQCVRYYSPNFNFGFSSGLQAGISFQPSGDETLVLNIAAMGGVAYGVAILIYRIVKP